MSLRGGGMIRGIEYKDGYIRQKFNKGGSPMSKKDVLEKIIKVGEEGIKNGENAMACLVAITAIIGLAEGALLQMKGIHEMKGADITHIDEDISDG